MNQLIQQFSKFELDSNHAHGIDSDTVVATIERSRAAVANLDKISNADFLESLGNLFTNNKEKAFSEAFNAMNDLNEMQLAFTMLGAELSRMTLDMQVEINTSQNDVKNNNQRVLAGFEYLEDYIQELQRAILINKDSIVSLERTFKGLLNYFSSDDINAIERLATFIQESKFVQYELNKVHATISTDFKNFWNQVENFIKEHKVENNNYIKEVERTLTDNFYRNLDKNKNETSAKIYNQSELIHEEIHQIKSEVGEIDLKTTNKTDSLFHLIILKEELLSRLIDENNREANKGLRLAENSRMSLEKRLLENNKRLETLITYNYSTSSNQINAIKIQMTHAYRWLTSMTILTLVLMAWVIYTSITH